MATMVSELPNEGDTELREIVNLTADAHPIHLHLVQFQLLNRQPFDLKNYAAAYGLAFPAVAGSATCIGGVYCPAFGPPLNNTPNASSSVGGNPDVLLFLKGAATPAGPQEAGWKDTVMVPPGMVTRFVVRWTPTSAPIGATGLAARFPFDPSGAGSAVPFGYVWHRHIIDHEDNEMMRPDCVTALPVNDAAGNPIPRPLVKGVGY